jgi:hypothetical protein
MLRDRILDNEKIDEAWPERNHQKCLDLVEARYQFKDHAEFGKWLDDGGIKMSKDDRAAAIAMGKEPERLLKLLKETERRSLRMIYLNEWAPPFRSAAKSPPLSSPAPKVTPEQERAARVIERRRSTGEPLDEKSVREEADVSSTPYRRAKAVDDAEQVKVKEETPEEPLARSAEAKVQAAINRETKRLQVDFDLAVRAEVKQRMDNYEFPRIRSEIDRVMQAMKNPPFAVMWSHEYKKILAVLHPDNARPGNEAKHEEAFKIFSAYKPKIINLSKEKDELDRRRRLANLPKFPETREEWEALKAKTKAERAAARAERAAGKTQVK